MKAGERFLRDEPGKYLAVKEGWVLRGMTFTLVGEQWRLVVKIYDARRNPLVAFIVQPTIFTCWEYLYLHLTTTSAPLRWKTDKYYVK